MDELMKPVIRSLAECLPVHHTKVFEIKPHKSNGDIVLPLKELLEESSFPSSDAIEDVCMETVGKGNILKIKLCREKLMTGICNEILHISKYPEHLALVQTDKKFVNISTVLSSMATQSPKERVLDLASMLLCRTIINVLNRSSKSISSVRRVCHHDTDNGLSISESTSLSPTLQSIVSEFSAKFESVGDVTNAMTKDSSSKLYVCTEERLNTFQGRDGDHNIKIFSKSFVVDKSKKADVLYSYLSKRSMELAAQGQHKLGCGDGNENSYNDELLPFVVFYDFFFSSNPFNPNKISCDSLRDAVFINYNITRIAHIISSYNTIVKSVDKVDFKLLTLEIEWEIACKLINFYSVFENTFSPLFDKKESCLKIDFSRFLQYLTNLAKLFSKYYSTTKIITHDTKDVLVTRMNTRILLVKAVYSVFVFSLKDVLGMPIISNM